MAARWRITNDVAREELGADGRFTSIREVTFEVLDNGRTGSVMIPLRNYTPEMVASEVQRYADTILAVGQAGSQ